jgi:hypothetical protein
MSWLFSQALVEEYLEDTSSDGEQSAPLNGNLTPQGYCLPDKTTNRSRLSQFGMMFKPLMGNRGEELLTSYLEDFHVKTYHRPEKNLALMENKAECGNKWPGSFAKFDQNLFLWKTHQISLQGELTEFSETWPQWGLMQDGECWEQRTVVAHTNEKEYGLWPTPNTCDATRGSPETPEDKLRRGANTGWSLIDELGYYPHPEFVEWLMAWPIGWTDLKPLETDRFQKWLEEHGKS